MEQGPRLAVRAGRASSESHEKTEIEPASPLPPSSLAYVRRMRRSGLPGAAMANA